MKVKLILVGSVVLAISAGAAFAQSKTVTIEEFKPATGKLPTFNQQGAPQSETIDAKSLTVPTTAVDERGDGSFFRVDTPKGPVWLRRTSLRLQERAGTVTGCEALKKLQSASEAASPQRTAGSRALNKCED